MLLNRAPSPLVLFEGRRCRRRMRGAVQSTDTRFRPCVTHGAALGFGNVVGDSPTPPHPAFGHLLPHKSVGEKALDGEVIVKAGERAVVCEHAMLLNRAPSPLVLFEGRRCRRRMRGVVQSTDTRFRPCVTHGAAPVWQRWRDIKRPSSGHLDGDVVRASDCKMPVAGGDALMLQRVLV